MVSKTALPTIVFVHGAFHTPEHYQQLINKLRSVGFNVTIPGLPNTTLKADPGDALARDAACIVDTIRQIVSEGNDVVVICHSHGGTIGTEAISELCEVESMHLPKTGRGQLRGVIYLAAFVPAKSESTLQQYGDLPVAQGFEIREGGMGYHIMPEVFYNTTPEDLRKQAVDSLVGIPLSTMTSAATYGWYDHGLPITYVICDVDHVMPVSIQESAAVRCGQSRSEEDGINVKRIASDHSPFLSKLDELVEILSDAVGSV